MGKMDKTIKCKQCGEEMASNAKFCPNCGLKNKKPIFKKWWFWVLIIIILSGMVGNGGKDSDKNASNSEVESSSDKMSEKDNQIETETTQEESEAPDIELSTEFEKTVWKITNNNGCKLTTSHAVKTEGSDLLTVVCSILVENDEEKVNSLLDELSQAVVNSEEKPEITIVIGDITKGDDAPMMATASITNDGIVDFSEIGTDFNSAHNLWIKDQFNPWDGSHFELTKLIKQNLNDEKSYEHIETTYRNIATEDDMNEVNKVLSDSGYSQRVEIGDLFIMTKFSAKNGFGGVIKNTAYGIASYSKNTVTLIDIG